MLVEIASDRHVAHDVVPALWDWRPDSLREWAEVAWRERDSTEPWITYMPRHRLGSVLEVFEAVPERRLSSSLLRWLSRTLPGAGPLADRIWALLEREQWDGLE